MCAQGSSQFRGAACTKSEILPINMKKQIETCGPARGHAYQCTKITMSSNKTAFSLLFTILDSHHERLEIANASLKGKPSSKQQINTTANTELASTV
jgi:hypothetical protein